MILAIINIDKRSIIDWTEFCDQCFSSTSLLVLTNLTNTTLITILMSEIKIIVFQ